MILPYIIVSLSSCFYVYEFFLRVMPSVITNELMTEFHVSASLMSFMTASFLYAYAIMQIPSGLLCDRFGTRKVLSIAILVCAISTLIFQATHNFYFAILTRLAVGASAACAFIVPLTLTAHWLPAKRFALVAGLVQLMGCMGALIGGKPIAILTETLGWRTSLYYAAIIGFALSALVWTIIRDYPNKSPHKDHHEIEIENEWERLKSVLSHKQIWYIGFVGFCCWAPIGAMAELWGVDYISELEHISTSDAAGQIGIVWIAVALGSPLAGWLSNKIKSRKLPLIVCAVTALISTSALIYSQVSNPTVISLLLFLIGISASSQPITFALISDIMPKNIVATAVGFNNMCVVAGAFVCQPLIGALLDVSKWFYPTVDFTHYHSEHFKFALIILPIISFLGLMVNIYKIEETNCEYRKNDD